MMKIFHPVQGHGVRTIAVAPAAVDPTARVEGWLDAEGTPVTFNIRFIYGVAEVADEMGRFMVDKKLARKSRPLLTA